MEIKVGDTVAFSGTRYEEEEKKHQWRLKPLNKTTVAIAVGSMNGDGAFVIEHPDGIKAAEYKFMMGVDLESGDPEVRYCTAHIKQLQPLLTCDGCGEIVEGLIKGTNGLGECCWKELREWVANGHRHLHDTDPRCCPMCMTVGTMNFGYAAEDKHNLVRIKKAKGFQIGVYQCHNCKFEGEAFLYMKEGMRIPEKQ